MPIDISSSHPTTQKSRKPTTGILSYELNSGIGSKAKEAFFRELRILTVSGMDLPSALDLLQGQTKKKRFKNVIGSIVSQIRRGKELYEAFQSTKAFTDFEVISVKIGETTKRLPEVLDNLATFHRSKVELRRQLVSLLTYPVIIIVITIAVLYFMLSMVVPMFSDVFNQFDAELPYSTQKILWLSNNYQTIFLIFIGLLISLSLCIFLLRRNIALKLNIEKLLFKTPVFGRLIKIISLNQLCKTMALLLGSNISLPEALDLAVQVSKRESLKLALNNVKQEILKGNEFSVALKKSYIFEDKMVAMLSVGERTNELDAMFERLGEQYDDEIQHKAKLIGTILEPLIIVIVGAIVGIILISMYAPMFNLSNILQA